MRRGVRWTGWGTGAVWVLATACLGGIPDLEEGVEYRFPGSPVPVWRSQRPVSDRWLGSAEPWVRGSDEGGKRTVWLGARLAVRVSGSPAAARARWERLGLRWVREAAGGIQILQARDPWSAASAARVLAREAGTELSVPVMRRGGALHGGFVRRPDDPLFWSQWHLDNRDAAGLRLGVDLGVRAAWSVTRGAGVSVAICDDGFESTHPDLAAAASGAPHHDFITGSERPSVYGSHATCVAGLTGGVGSNATGVSGVAPAVKLASWVIFDTLGDIGSDEALADMFQNRIQEVSIQSHSWGNAYTDMFLPTALELAGISNAVTSGRGGLGVVMVRSAGNGREQDSDVNDDGYENDPRVIAVAAVRTDGRAASYSNPGACLLVGAPSGDEGDSVLPTLGVVTTDRVGRDGYNRSFGESGMPDYAVGDSAFSGTSAAAPQISGVVALILAANPGLAVRDVQQVLIHAARHHDSGDPDVRRNGAGYSVSHNQGFGTPDAGEAVRLAGAWSHRVPMVTVVVTNAGVLALPDAGLRVWVTEGDAAERSLICEPSSGMHPDDPTARVELVSVGLADAPLTMDLTGKAALIERGGAEFSRKLTYAKRAGARFGVFFNNTGGTTLDYPGATEYAGIPAVMISENAGRALVAQLAAGRPVLAQLRVDRVEKHFQVERSLICEHVGLKVRTRHARRGDVRVTLVSPSGTRSVLQKRNFDTKPSPTEWTYWSTQSFYESSAGVWTAEFADEAEGVTGEIEEVELVVRGVEIQDSDRDGLDDGWERRWFGGLTAGPLEDPDQDGSWNAREQALGTNPGKVDADFRLGVAPLEAASLRLNWPASGSFDYRVLGRDDPTGPERLEATLPGVFPELEWVTPVGAGSGSLYRIEAIPR